MPGAPKTSDEIRQAITLREGGYSLAAIAQKTGISPATLQRHFKRLGVGKGSLNAEAVDEVRQQLMKDAGFIDDLKQQIASAIVDDVAQFKRIREALALNIEELVSDTSLPAHYRSRGLTAAATALRLSQEIIRKALQIDAIEPEPESLPQLCVYELTAEEIAEMRQAQQRDPLYDQPEDIEIIDES